MLFSLLQTPAITPITSNAAVTKVAVIKDKGKFCSLRTPFFFVNCFQYFFLAQIGLECKRRTSAMMLCVENENDRKSIKCKQDKERKAVTQRFESAFEKRSASRIVDTLRTKPWQHVLDCDTARRCFDSRKHEIHESLREQPKIDFGLLGLPLLLF
jgi:hypothetical protein